MYQKLSKRIFAFLIAVFAILAVTGCETPVQSAKEIAKVEMDKKVAEIQKAVTFDPTATKDVIAGTVNLLTTTKYTEITIAWSSSEPDVIDSEGNVNRMQSTDPRAENGSVPVVLTATITGEFKYIENEVEQSDSVSVQKTFNFSVKCLEPSPTGTIAEMKAQAWNYVYKDPLTTEKGLNSSDSKNGYTVQFDAVVTAVLNNGGMGIMVHDGTEGIYIYYNNSGINVGDVVNVYGDIYAYYGSLQVGSNVTVKSSTAEGIKIGEYRDLSVSEWEKETALNEDGKTYPDSVVGYFGGKLVNVYAKLEKGSNSGSDVYKLVDPLDGTVAWIYYKSYAEKSEMLSTLESFVGKYVYARGVTYDRDSRGPYNHLLWDGTIVEAPAPELTDAQKLNQVKLTLATLEGSYIAGTKLALPTENAEYGATITWTLTPSDVLVGGKFALVDADTEVTAVAKVVVGALEEDVTVKLTVKKLVTYTIAEAIAKEVGTVVKLEGTIEVVYSKYYLKDDTGTLLVYASLPADFKLGDKVELIGTTANFNGTPQIANGATLTLVEAADWQQSCPTVLTVSEVLAYTKDTAPYGSYLAVEGVLVKSGTYFYLADAANKDLKISLYSSTVTDEKLTAAADTDTKVTLFFYFYGNAKADWSGDYRVIFVQRSGEFFVGEETVVFPEKKEYLTIAQAKAAASGTEVTIRATVVKVGDYVANADTAKDWFGALLVDETGALYIYSKGETNAKDLYAALKVGDLVDIKGEMALYKGLYELTNATAEGVNVIESGKDVSALAVMSNDLKDQAKMVKLEYALWNGSKFVKGADEFAYYYVASFLAEKPTLETGKYYTVVGWVNWYNNAQITPTEAVVLVAEDDVPAEVLAANKIAALLVSSPVDADFDLAAGFTWTVVSGTAITIEEGVAKVTRGTEDAEVVLQAELSGVTKQFTVVVTKEGAAAAVTSINMDFAGLTNKTTSTEWLKIAKYAGWTQVGNMGQCYGDYAGFARSGDTVSSLVTPKMEIAEAVTITAAVKGNSTDGVSYFEVEAVDKDGIVIGTAIIVSDTASKSTVGETKGVLDTTDSTIVLSLGEKQLVDGKTLADITNFRVTYHKTAGNMGLKSIVIE